MSDDVEESSESREQSSEVDARDDASATDGGTSRDAADSPEDREQAAEASGEATADEQQWAAAAADPSSQDVHDEEDAANDEDTEGPGLGKTLLVDERDLPGALEALVLVSDKPVSAVRLARLSRSDLNAVKAALDELRERYRDRGIVLDEVAGGYQFRTHPRYAPVVRNLIQQKPARLTKAQLEVLSIIAYRQPVTRPEVEDVRGVDSGSALRVLLERGVIRIIGKKDEAGRPMLYATTPDFLSLFGLKSLRDLPTLKEFSDLSDESRDMFERRIGERPPLEGFTDDARDARTAAEQEQATREGAEDDDEGAEDDDEGQERAPAGGDEAPPAAEREAEPDAEQPTSAASDSVDDAPPEGLGGVEAEDAVGENVPPEQNAERS